MPQLVEPTTPDAQREIIRLALDEIAAEVPCNPPRHRPLCCAHQPEGRALTATPTHGSFNRM